MKLGVAPGARHNSFSASSEKEHLLPPERGQGCICDPVFLSKSDAVEPLCNPLRLCSLIPFPATGVALIMLQIDPVCKQKGLISCLPLGRRTLRLGRAPHRAHAATCGPKRHFKVEQECGSAGLRFGVSFTGSQKQMAAGSRW